MKPGGRIILAATFIFFIAAVIAQAQSFSLLSATPTNSITQTYNSTNMAWDITDTNALVKYLPPRYWTGQSREENYSNSTSPGIYTTNLIPLIQFEDVPLTVAVENLARQAGINYALDPYLRYGQLNRYGQRIVEPTLTLRWTNITAEQGLEGVCMHYGLVVVRDPETHVVLLRRRGHNVDFAPTDFYGNETNVIPLIEFQDVPALAVLKALVKQAGIKCIFSALIDTGRPENGPALSLRWKNLTARQALAAFCENYDLNIIKYPESGIIRIEPAY
jgi:hypothetical protein